MFLVCIGITLVLLSVTVLVALLSKEKDDFNFIADKNSFRVNISKNKDK